MQLINTAPATNEPPLATMPRNQHQWVQVEHHHTTRWCAPMKQKITQSITIGVLITIMCFVISLMPEQQAVQIQQADSAEKIISTATMTIVRKD